jgi:hypothetical protein
MQALCLFAGANSTFVGDTLLTAANPDDDPDAALFGRLRLQSVRDSPRRSGARSIRLAKDLEGRAGACDRIAVGRYNTIDKSDAPSDLQDPGHDLKPLPDAA